MGLRPRKLSDTAAPTAMPPRRMPTILRRVPPLPHRMPTPRRMSPPCCMLPLRRGAPHAVAALMCEPRGASGRRSRRKSPRTDKALPTRQCSDFNAPRAATNAAVYATATEHRLLLSTAGTRRHRRGAIGFARVSGNFAERWSWGARG